MSDPSVSTVTVRYYAAARAAAGTAEEHVRLVAGASVAELVDLVGSERPELARVLLRCSFLHDEVVVRDPGDQLRAGSVLDVLPPFAGG